MLLPLPASAASCVDAETRDRIKTLMNEAMDSAFKQQAAFLFGVWMKDLTGQPQRARTGVAIAMHAYLQVRRNVVRWEPPACR
jgi:hypothetical protein